MGALCRPSVPAAAALVFALVVLSTGIVLVQSNGSVEIRLHRFVVDGCCGLAPSVSFRICVRNYQATVNLDSPCIIGESVSRQYGDNELLQLSETYHFPFNFTWTGSFSFVVEAYNNSEEVNGETRLLSRFVAQRYLSPKEDWQRQQLSSSGPTLDLSYRIKCEANYYGDRCDVHCKARDDKYFGHYTCDMKDGHRVCMAGWKGDYCDIAICRLGCSEKYGTCKEPYDCQCRSGWEGQFCDICSPYPGCLHGTCNGPWQCNCNEGWGGLFCSEDLNYCTNHRPCGNGGTCTNTGQGSYTCTCSDDFMGVNCDVLRNPCKNNPCQNGGTCLNPHEGEFKCRCLLGFYGPNCETSASICTNNPCQNGGSCVHDPEGYTCACAPGFSGIHCEKVTSSCTSSMCQNNGTCLHMPYGPICHCPHGFSGVHCEENLFCDGEPCLNDGKCLEDSGSFRCDCAAGFTGAFCEIELHNCLPNPCNNGGTCQEQNASYHCLCRTGFSGRNCSITDPCSSSPCLHGGKCKTDSASFSCHCTDEYYGPHCEYSSVPHIKRTNFPNAISNVSLQLSNERESEPKSQVVVIVVCSLVGMAAFLACAICLAIKCFKKRRQPKQISEAREDELKQNERNMLQMNNKCVVPQNKIVNTLDRMPTKVNNDESVKVVNAQMENKKMPEKNILYMQRTLERRDNICSSGNSGCHSSQEWSPCNSGGVYIIQDHIRPLKGDDCYQPRPPLLSLVDNDKVFATEV